MKIENYIQKNRDKLNAHEPDINGIWKNIEHGLNSSKVRRMNTFRWIAASILVFLVVGALIRHEITVQKQITSLSQISKELAKQENEYHYKVNQKWTQYIEMNGNASPITPILIKELQELDTIYQKGLNDIKQKGYNERAVIILLETYEKRLRIIEKLIYEKQKQTNYENRNKKIKI